MKTTAVVIASVLAAASCADASFYSRRLSSLPTPSYQADWDAYDRCATKCLVGKPRMYNTWMTWRRVCDERCDYLIRQDSLPEQNSYDLEENAGSNELGCYLFPQAPVCNQDHLSEDVLYDLEDGPEFAGSNELGCYLFPQAPICQ